MSSRRQQIVDAVAGRMALIAPGHSFTLPDGTYVCGGTIKGVYPWRKKPFSKAEVPAIKFNDEDAQVVPGPSTQHENRLSFTLEAAILSDTTASAARALLADIVAAIGSDPRWGGLAYWTDIQSHSVDLEQARDVISGVQILFTVTYRTPLWRM